MEINSISAQINIQNQSAINSADRISRRIIENRDGDGDGRLSVSELPGRAEILSLYDANGDNFADQEELFTALAGRIAEQSSVSVQISLDINVIKANLGGLLSGALQAAEPERTIPGQSSATETNALERFINASIVDGLETGGLFNSSGSLISDSDTSGIGSLFGSSAGDGRQLLVDLLVEQLGTSREDAISIVSVLQNQSFSITA